MYTNVGVYVPSTMNVQDVQFYSGKLYIICPSDVLYDRSIHNMQFMCIAYQYFQYFDYSYHRLILYIACYITCLGYW